MKEQENKNPEKSTDEAEINNLPDEEFKTLVIRMLAEQCVSNERTGKQEP